MCIFQINLSLSQCFAENSNQTVLWQILKCCKRTKTTLFYEQNTEKCPKVFFHFSFFFPFGACRPFNDLQTIMSRNDKSKQQTCHAIEGM